MEVKFLCHLVSKDGMRANPDKNECNDRIDCSKRRLDLPCLLGLCNYNQKFIDKFAELAYQLFKCLIVFTSRNLKHAEINYSIKDREILALVLATKSLVTVSFADVFEPFSPLTSHVHLIISTRSSKEWPRGSQNYPSKQNVIDDSLSRNVSGLTLQCELDAKNEQTLDDGIRTIMDIMDVKKDRNQDNSLYYVNNRSQRLVIPEIICNDLVIKVKTEDLAYNLLKTRDKLKIPKPACKPIWPDNTFTDWHVDFMGRLNVTSKGYEYVIIFVDRGSSFTGPNGTRGCTLFGQKHSLSFSSARINPFETQSIKSHNMPYHPEGNGLAERYIRAL
ncbi:hypothetical protein RF11_12971 [Thelohanellus kitauei]|uniref:Uncharacterized protein n=1 Tax=Thelohanellus kitauei TaxID=669202 RepID=A0A0C2MLV9_THEKT|nr:hypothetical protein RF11_12971 [Thelohanellus kitauei]